MKNKTPKMYIYKYTIKMACEKAILKQPKVEIKRDCIAIYKVNATYLEDEKRVRYTTRDILDIYDTSDKYVWRTQDTVSRITESCINCIPNFNYYALDSRKPEDVMYAVCSVKKIHIAAIRNSILQRYWERVDFICKSFNRDVSRSIENFIATASNIAKNKAVLEIDKPKHITQSEYDEVCKQLDFKNMYKATIKKCCETFGIDPVNLLED